WHIVTEVPGAALILTAVLALPLVITAVNLLSLKEGMVTPACRRLNWVLTVLAGGFDSFAYAAVCDMTTLPWDAQLFNSQLHQPIWGDALPTVATLIAVGVVGFVVLACFKLDRLSPLVIVTCIAAMYVSAATLLVFSVQVMGQAPMLALPPFNLVVMAATLVREKVREWNENPEHQIDRYGGEGLMGRLNARLADSASWPLWALVFSLPLLGVVLAVLVLFGQRPDYVVRAWTETADWTLSTKEAPVNLVQDEHYLCTVAASGDPDLVKPLRYGERHGHRIVVNRQLLVANAFENVLEEKTPRFHRVVRGLYDTYGFPVADLIRHSRLACDVTYLVMKPLEWLFLLVLYLVDVNPENRIAVQYLPPRP
ncbi:MAG: hypothetical protein IJ092_13365, partial [Atopobiaceae bacterium]|nr:hypothetical protein [Atopobiaceae bacterium]